VPDGARPFARVRVNSAAPVRGREEQTHPFCKVRRKGRAPKGAEDGERAGGSGGLGFLALAVGFV
jgi:hypothetical protein